jgi:hypothetical protein
MATEKRKIKMAYQFSHISAFYSYQKRLAYAFNRIELGDMYDRAAMQLHMQSTEKGGKV